MMLFLDYDGYELENVADLIITGRSKLPISIRGVHIKSRGDMHHHVYLKVVPVPPKQFKTELEYRKFIMTCQKALGSDPEREAMLESRAISTKAFPNDTWNEFWLSKNGGRYIENKNNTKELIAYLNITYGL